MAAIPGLIDDELSHDVTTLRDNTGNRSAPALTQRGSFTVQ
jgi:hypothetical protein